MNSFVNFLPFAPPLRGATSFRPVNIRVCRNNLQTAGISEKQFPRSLFALFDKDITSAGILIRLKNK